MSLYVCRLKHLLDFVKRVSLRVSLNVSVSLWT